MREVVRRSSFTSYTALALCAMAGAACTGVLGGGSGEDDKGNGSETGDGVGGPGDPSTGALDLTDEEVVQQVKDGLSASSAVRRLARREIDRAVVEVFGMSGGVEPYVPSDLLSPFDTDSEGRDVSQVFVEGVESMAYAVGLEKSTDAAWISATAGCQPAGSADTACLTSLTEALGGRLWRRPLSEVEVSEIVTSASAFATERDDFAVGARLVIMTLLQGAEFLYRVEVGEPDAEDPSLYRLTNLELVSRLSFLIWGTGPSEALLDRAAGEPLDSAALQELAREMLQDPKASAQIMDFHRLWLGYEKLRVTPELTEPMMAETTDTLDHILLTERLPWSTVFTATGTVIGQDLATHYGMSAPASATPTWMEYEHPERRGVLSHGSILSLGSLGSEYDSSPTRRGHYVASRLLCREVPEPPADVNVDDPPEPGPEECKTDTYAAHADQGGPCFTCHQSMDPVGFGLERFDALGRYRTVEPQNDACQITGEGEVVGLGTFNGISELVDVMEVDDELSHCASKQFFHFAMGRSPKKVDEAIVDRVHSRFLAEDEIRELILAFVIDSSFLYRKGL